MATIKSVFGAYADSKNLQYLVDKALDKFTPTWFQNYFDWAPKTYSLNFITVIGRSRVEAAASVVDRGAKAPLRSRQALEKLEGTVPPIMEKFFLDEKILRDFLMLRNMPGVGTDAVAESIIQLITDDVTKAANSTLKRIDYMALEGVSTGQISLTTTNNPDGVVLPTAIDLLMPSGNKQNATVNWDTVATAKPISVDFLNIKNLASARGIKHVKALMTWNSWFKFIATQEVKDMFNQFLGKSSNKLLPDLDGVNDLLRKQQLPTIDIVDVSIGIEKNGVITTYNPFSDTNVAFIPEGSLGKIHNAFAIEETNKINQVSYAMANRTLISKWGDNDPYQEWTKAELNAMPGIEAIDQIYLLSRTVAF
jgi:hypothetical protein